MPKTVKWYETKLAACGGAIVLNAIGYISEHLSPTYGVYIWAVLFILGVILILWAYFKGDKKVATEDKATKPETIQSATTLGNNSSVIQAFSGAKVFSGISDEGLNQIRDGMLAIQKQKDIELQAEFNLGYILFTATKRSEIVPLDSPMDDILKVDWKSGYDVSFSGDVIKLRLPKMVFDFPNIGTLNFDGCGVKIRPFKSSTLYAIDMGNYKIGFKVVSTNEDSVVIAMGIKSPPSIKEKNL